MKQKTIRHIGENGMLEYLRPGEDIELPNGAIPGDTFDPDMIALDRIMNKICMEIIKAVALIAVGYAWATSAYGVFT